MPKKPGDRKWPTTRLPAWRTPVVVSPELKRLGKTYEFHMYPNAGHGFFYYDRPAYGAEQAVDGREKIFVFLEKYVGA